MEQIVTEEPKGVDELFNGCECPKCKRDLTHAIRSPLRMRCAHCGHEWPLTDEL